MTEKLHFKTWAIERAIKAARRQSLVVESYCVEPDGTIRVLVAPPPSGLDRLSTFEIGE